jgi:hypothetical protein
MATTRQDIDQENAQFLGTIFPQIVRNLGTNFPVYGLSYDAATEQNAYWKLRATNYGSGNLTLTVTWYADTASTNDIIWGCSIAAITPNTDTQDVETKAFATAQTATDTHLGTTGQRVHEIDITISNLDSIANGDRFWLRVYRDADAGGDTMAGAGILIGLHLSYSDT